jgi:hypothetical protein
LGRHENRARKWHLLHQPRNLKGMQLPTKAHDPNRKKLQWIVLNLLKPWPDLDESAVMRKLSIQNQRKLTQK